MMDNEKNNQQSNTTKDNNGIKVNVLPHSSRKSSASAKQFKDKYFDYYDDVKDYTRGREDW